MYEFGLSLTSPCLLLRNGQQHQKIHLSIRGIQSISKFDMLVSKQNVSMSSGVNDIRQRSSLFGYDFSPSTEKLRPYQVAKPYGWVIEEKLCSLIPFWLFFLGFIRVWPIAPTLLHSQEWLLLAGTIKEGVESSTRAIAERPGKKNTDPFWSIPGPLEMPQGRYSIPCMI